MKAFLWRIVYAAVCFILFWMVFPLFLEVIHAPINGSLMELMRIVSIALAVLYVLFGPSPTMPF